ncbi:hypothetical protein [Arcicella rigui]|uniref:DUF2281 domain-containing protein n=1 Tax=Arcicella rigui TaxID=797020 RepID=A0ABU5QCS2_9BACT|nr:hypothetical protein [Arcicella rigui]MEA5140635.1 hypothetical protein [Arcicella rigui]
MLTAIEGVYDNGQIILKEKPELTHKVKVFVMFTEEEVLEQPENTKIAVSGTSMKGTLRGAWKNIDPKDKEDIKNHFENIRNEWERDI